MFVMGDSDTDTRGQSWADVTSDEEDLLLFCEGDSQGEFESDYVDYERGWLEHKSDERVGVETSDIIISQNVIRNPRARAHGSAQRPCCCFVFCCFVSLCFSCFNKQKNAHCASPAMFEAPAPISNADCQN